MDNTAAFYSCPSYAHIGGNVPIFSGARRQRGGSIFGAIKRFFLPVISAFGKKIARQGAKQAIGLAKDVAKDAFMMKNIPDSLKEHGKKRALNLGRYAADEGLTELQKLVGAGYEEPPKQAPRKRATPKRAAAKRSGKRKAVSKKRPTKKRRTAKPLF